MDLLCSSICGSRGCGGRWLGFLLCSSEYESLAEICSQCRYEHLFLVFRQHTVLPIELVAFPDKMAGEDAPELDVEGGAWQQVLVEPDLLTTTGSTKPWDLQVEEVFAHVIVEFGPQVCLSVSDFNEWVLSLISIPVLESRQ